MKRRDFITLLGGAAAAWPLVARAQQGERVRHIDVLLPAAADDPVWQARFGAFLQALAVLGWTIGRNVHIDTHWAIIAKAWLVSRRTATRVTCRRDPQAGGGNSRARRSAAW